MAASGRPTPSTMPRPVRLVLHRKEAIRHQRRLGGAALTLRQRETKVKQEVLQTTHRLGESRPTHLISHLHLPAPHRTKTAPTLHSPKAPVPRHPTHLISVSRLSLQVMTPVEQPALLRHGRRQMLDRSSEAQHARRVRVLQGSLLSSTAQATMTPRQKTTRPRSLLTLCRRTPKHLPLIPPTTPRLVPSPVLRRRRTRPAGNSRMQCPSKPRARLLKAATPVLTVLEKLPERTNQQCMTTIPLPFFQHKQTKCPPLSTPLGHAINATKALKKYQHGLFLHLFDQPSAVTRQLNAPGTTMQTSCFRHIWGGVNQLPLPDNQRLM